MEPSLDPDLAALLTGFPVLISWPVQWGDQDAYQHVNNTVYVRWLETARIDYTRRLGLGEMMRQKQIGPILAALSCDYRRQVTFPDTIHIGSKITRIGRTSFAMENALVSQASRALVAESKSTLVLYDYAGSRPVPIPDEVRRAIEAIEGKPL
jgi:acyl-CoA thioester hydrolase